MAHQVHVKHVQRITDKADMLGLSYTVEQASLKHYRLVSIDGSYNDVERCMAMAYQLNGRYKYS